MYHIVICDDEETILENLGETIEAEFAKKNLQVHKTLISDAYQLQEIMQKEAVDVLFLDIDMPYMNGMELAAWLQEEKIPTLLVFVTNQDTLVYQTFRYQPFGFIRKSVFKQEIGEVVERLHEKLHYSKDYMVWQQGGESIKLKLAEIYYFESDSNYVKVITKEKTYRFRDTLAALEKQLEPKGFIRIHKGFLMNGEKLHVLKADAVIMEDGTTLPIGRSYAEEVKKKVMLLMRKFTAETQEKNALTRVDAYNIIFHSDGL